MSAKQNSTRPERSLRPGWFFLPRLVPAPVAGAPGWLRGRRLLFVSDVHLRRCVSDARLAAFVDLLASARADMLLLGGDYAESEADCRRLLGALAPLRFPLGGYAVPGNNDRAGREALRAWMAEAGLELLVNEARRVELPGGCLEIGGCDDHKYGSPRTADLFAGGGSYRVLLSHFPAPPDCDCELMLSGHTHGGQFCLGGRTPYDLGYERRFHLLAARGRARIGGMELLVCNGVGVSKLPLRVNAGPEVLLVEFVGAAAGAKLPEKCTEKFSAANCAARLDSGRGISYN